ncbi:hypothetical protein MARBORIA2_18810 [Methanobrevibacter arboriphilus]|jgi:hypothetical protein|uniref:Uncharacterized protein n=1 Tax=Methanobrevibacter arboriphilus TaxID=39441 RepID=A0ACA8R0N2_METAZ|nr:hypothetical protein [Methanobrevibacter arboriphilus]MCC7561578.1 hypothetical protein [Methanobrevibacter arboriphilus]BBL60975.1 hypothetical protein MarbSA_00150 [Methanobrevibacter arboriphilus]GLI12791.1 hypothetical protein MARBORIA2_18810 [Methanobrevibacter arboriphilus]
MEKGLFKVDWAEIFRIFNNSFDFLENKGIKFDFNDPVIKKLFKKSCDNESNVS